MARLEVDIIGDISGLSDSIRDAENQLESFGKSVSDIGQNLSLALTAPLVAFAGVSAKTFGDVEKGLREINTIIGLTGAEADKNLSVFTDQAAIVSKELGILQTDIVPGLYNAISAGVPNDNVFSFIRTAGQAAIGGVTDINTAVDGLTSIVNAFNLDFAETGAVADSVFAAVQGGKTTFEEIASSIFNVAPAAAAAKVAFTEVNAAIATLTASGTPTSVATTQIRAALTGLQRPSAELDVIFQKLGFQSAQLALEQKGLGFALDAVVQASNGNNGALQNLLGSVEAVSAANIIAGTGAAKFTQELERQANAAGSTANAFEQVDQSFSRQLERSFVALSNFSIVVGERLAPALSVVANLVEKAANSFGELGPVGQTVIVVLGAVAASIGPLLLAIGGVISIIPTLTAGLAAVKVALIAVTGPIGLAVAALVAGAVLIIANWDSVKSAFENSGIGNILSDLGRQFVGFLASTRIIFTGLIEIVKIVADAFIFFLKPVLAFFAGEFIRTIKFAIDTIANVFGFLKNILEGDFSTAGERLKVIFLNLAKNIIETLTPVLKFIPAIGDVVDATISKIDARLKSSKQIIEGREAWKNFESNAKESLSVVNSEVVKTGQIVKQTFEEFSRLTDLINAETFAKWEAEAKAFNNELEESIDISKRLKAAFEGIDVNKSLGIVQPIEIPIKLGDVPTTERAEEDNSLFSQFLSGIQRARTEFEAFATDFEQRTFDFVNSVALTVENGLFNTFSSLGDALGNALATGQNVFEALGASLLNSIAGFLGDLGKQLIAYGVAGTAFGKLTAAIAAGGPAAIAAGPLAIAAGVALTAIAGALRSTASRGLSGGGSSSTGTASTGATISGGSGIEGFNFNQSFKFEPLTLEGDKIRYAVIQSNNYSN
jgi:TP901 family phage tail tape measure protein